MWKDINIVCLMAYGDLVEQSHTHSAIELPLTMTNIETLIGQSLS